MLTPQTTPFLKSYHLHLWIKVMYQLVDLGQAIWSIFLSNDESCVKSIQQFVQVYDVGEPGFRLVIASFHFARRQNCQRAELPHSKK